MGLSARAAPGAPDLSRSQIRLAAWHRPYSGRLLRFLWQDPGMEVEVPGLEKHAGSDEFEIRLRSLLRPKRYHPQRSMDGAAICRCRAHSDYSAASIQQRDRFLGRTELGYFLPHRVRPQP